MPNVTTVFARVMAEAAGMSLTKDGVLTCGGAALRSFRLLENDRMDAGDYFELLQCVREAHGDDVALLDAYAKRVTADDLGVLGLAIKTAPTLRESLQRVDRYYKLVTDTAVYRLEESEEAAAFVFDPVSAQNATLEFRNEGALAGFAQNMRRFVGADLVLDLVTFRHSCRGDPARYANIFGCPVVFDADRDAIEFDPAMLSLSNRLGDAAVSEFLSQHLETEFASLRDDTSLGNILMHRLTPKLSTGMPQAGEVAREMGLSERTLYRRLAEEGLTFRNVVGRAQSALAQELLRDSDASIAEIAFLTGFSEQSTFSRAFKRWFGQAPAQFRQHASRA